ncbi:unnamed protein product [Cuscuta campestris]|uniref:Uncharacterized protein n=1 Tax=Cuscuta campestris TaxID=132261 RepID=A0A484KRM7_9ASTE|nr:unnamed protein product [Cuscuta campestris]
MAASSTQSDEKKQQEPQANGYTQTHQSVPITAQTKTNRTHNQSCKERMKGMMMPNKMMKLHHAGKQQQQPAAFEATHRRAADNETMKTKKKKKETHCMPKIRDHLKNFKAKNSKTKEKTNGSSSSSDDENDHGKAGSRKAKN